MIAARGGTGVAVRVDHSDPEQVKRLFERVSSEHGKLDILVNDIWGGERLAEWFTPVWKHSLDNGLHLLRLAIDTHIITSHFALPLLIRRPGGLVVEVTDGTAEYNATHYRLSVFYDLAKVSVIRLAYAMAEELRPHGITALAVTPGFLRSEAVLDTLGVTEANWQEGARVDPHFIASETPFYVGRAVAALAADPQVARKAGTVQSSWRLAEEYGFRDVDGRQPHWGRYYAQHLARSGE